MNEYKMIIEHYGEDQQKLEAVGKLNDLADQLIQDMEKNKCSRVKTLDKIAEVKIMLEQILIMYGISGKEITNREFIKLHKTIKRIEKETV